MFAKSVFQKGCYSHSLNASHKKLETWKCFVLLKMDEIRREYNFRSEKFDIYLKIELQIF